MMYRFGGSWKDAEKVWSRIYTKSLKCDKVCESVFVLTCLLKIVRQTLGVLLRQNIYIVGILNYHVN